MKVNAKPVRRSKALKNTGSTQKGVKSERRPGKFSESGSKKPKLQRKCGSGKEVSSSTLQVKAYGTGSLKDAEVGVREAEKLGHASRRFQGSRCHGRLSSGYSWKVGSLWLASGATFHYFLKKVIGSINVCVGNKGVLDGLWRGERKCIDPNTGDADLWIEIWEELHSLAAGEIQVEVEHVKAKCTKKDMLHCEQFVTEGNEEADDLAEGGAMLEREVV